ncbi:MAG: acyl-CoA dehydrogenase family protein [Kiloniellales bacterium]
MSYQAPLDDMLFVLEEIADLEGLTRLPGMEEASGDLVEAVLSEAGRLSAEVLAPLNQSGDQEGASLQNGVVRTPKGFVEAYGHFVEGGWNGLTLPAEYGGQGLPYAVGSAATEMWNAANMAFALCPLLTSGALDLLHAHGTEAQKALYLPKMATGLWSGTMNLTEPQAGTDVGALKTKAVADGDHYRISGQKIYITHGEQDMSENIVHLVLARVPGAPEGSKGISLFIVPKYLPNPDGSLGARNDLRCVSLEHKLGVHGSPTCVMSYGDDGGAIGFLIGQENHGMEYMFTMMNAARIEVGIQGVAIADRALQQAVAFAKDRKQSRALGSRDVTPVPIIKHADVRRNLATMRALSEAGRALALVVGAAVDRNRHAPDGEDKALARAQEEVLTPVVKAWLTDRGCEVASLGIQVHGGMGFIEETGAAQHYRDARILPIYEGTNGIQALDLVMRKILRDKGAMLSAVLGWMTSLVAKTEASDNESVSAMAPALTAAIQNVSDSCNWLIETSAHDLDSTAAGATPFLSALGYSVGGVLLAASAASAARRLGEGVGDPAFNERKIKTAHFYHTNLLPYVEAESHRARAGAQSAHNFAPEDF